MWNTEREQKGGSEEDKERKKKEKKKWLTQLQFKMSLVAEEQ